MAKESFMRRRICTWGWLIGAGFLSACDGGRLGSEVIQRAQEFADAPGPDILYAEAPRVPQFENTGVWQAEPLKVSGASAYVQGEFLYQDWIYDDHGANGGLPDPVDPAAGLLNGAVADGVFSRYAGTYNYPDDPVYANNAADLLEFRVTRGAGATLFRLSLNTLLDANRVAATLTLGTTGTPSPLPAGANLDLDHAFSLTWAEGRAVVRDHTGVELANLPLRVDLERRQLELRLPDSVLNLRGSQQTFWLGLGLWDPEADAYLVPTLSRSATQPGGAGLLSNPPAFFNLGFRFAEPEPDIAGQLGVGAVVIPRWWRDAAQAEALALGEAGQFRVQVDFAKLESGVTDFQFNQPEGVPTFGPINRIYGSRFSFGQGVDYAQGCGSADGCTGILVGQLQPYSLYVPNRPVPQDGWGLTLLLHSLGGNYNQYHASAHQQQFGERGRGYLVLSTSGRGPDGWYVDYAGAETFEAWADVRAHYLLNPAFTSISGYSMGGHGTFRFATQFPDLFARAQTVVGPPAVGVWVPPLTNPGPASNTFEALESLYHVPVQSWVASADQLVPYLGPRAQADRLFELGYRSEFWTFAPAEHLTLAAHDQYLPAAEFLGDAQVVNQPRTVVFKRNPAMDFPAAGIVADHAYWLSDIQLRDASLQTGFVEAESLALPASLGPAAANTGTTAGLLQPGTLGAIGYLAESLRWEGERGDVPQRNVLRITLQNIAELTVDMQAAGLSCRAQIEVNADGPARVIRGGC